MPEHNSAKTSYWKMPIGLVQIGSAMRAKGEIILYFTAARRTGLGEIVSAVRAEIECYRHHFTAFTAEFLAVLFLRNRRIFLCGLGRDRCLRFRLHMYRRRRGLPCRLSRFFRLRRLGFGLLLRLKIREGST